MSSPKQRYTEEEFLEYYDFEDEPSFVPRTFYAKQKGYENLIENVKNDVRNGVKINDAIRLNAGVWNTTVSKWKKEFIKEVEDGKVDTPLIRLFKPALKSDAKLYREVMKLTLDKAREGDASTIQYLAKHRLGYNSGNKQEVELSSNEDVPVKFVFTDMTPTENDE